MICELYLNKAVKNLDISQRSRGQNFNERQVCSCLGRRLYPKSKIIAPLYSKGFSRDKDCCTLGFPYSSNACGFPDPNLPGEGLGAEWLKARV